jgi:hypothetical protein
VSRFGGTQVDNGDWISSTCCRNQYYIVKAGATTWAAGPASTLNSVVADEVTSEKWAAPGRSVWLCNYRPSGQIVHLDLVAGAATTVYATKLGPVYEVLPLWNRDLGSLRTGRGQWAVSIAPDKPKAFAGRPFVLAASLTPPSPGGIVLPDGRQIFIGIDVLTVLTLAGPVPPFLTGNTGNLDANGRATAKLDLSSLGKAANGIVLHFCAAVPDPNAPAGLAWVCDPHALVIDN